MSATPPVATVPAVAERERAELDDVRASLFVPARAAALEADFEEILAGL